MLAIRLPTELEQRLIRLATLTKRSKSFYAKEALEKYLDDLEDIYISLDRLENPTKTWSLEEIEHGKDLES